MQSFIGIAWLNPENISASRPIVLSDHAAFFREFCRFNFTRMFFLLKAIALFSVLSVLSVFWGEGRMRDFGRENGVLAAVLALWVIQRVAGVAGDSVSLPHVLQFYVLQFAL